MILKEQILEEYKKGNVCVSVLGELISTPMAEFLKQPTDGILYDLNRDEATILNFIDDRKWVNDYALTAVVRALKAELETVRNEAFESGAKAQREICANHAKVGSDYLPARDDMTYFVERESILSAPLAKLEDL